MPSASNDHPAYPGQNSVNSQKDNPQYESVQVRQRGAWDFASYYESLCVLQDSCPLQAVKANLNTHSLDINADRVREEDWDPIINSIKINKSLERITMKSYHDPDPEDTPTPRYPVLKSSRKTPPIRKKEVINKLCKSLRSCLKTTNNLKTLELQGIPLSQKDMEEISNGLHANGGTLTKLALDFCDIGNDGVEILCIGLKQALSVSFLDLTCCNVTAVGAAALAKLVVYQSSLRHAEAWQDSLRYRRPNLDMLMGLRRIVLNGNSLIGDEGAACFADALRDDLWLKALDLQKCGLTNDGAKALLNVLKYSVTMVVCDIRKNAFIDKELIRSVTEQCLINCQGHDSEYPWLKMKSCENPDLVKLRMKTMPPAAPTPRSSGSRSGRKVKKSKSMKEVDKPVTVPMGCGYPWRTAMRVNRHRNLVKDDQDLPDAGNRIVSARSEGYKTSHFNNKYSTDHLALGTSDDENLMALDYSRKAQSGAPNLSSKPNGVQSARADSSELEMRHVIVELEKMKMKLERETDARRRCDQRLVDLEIENSRLRREVVAARSGHSTAGNLSEEQTVILDSVEDTFKKFSKFLDLLRQAGFGDLADLAGLDSQHLEKLSGQKLDSKRVTGSDFTAGQNFGGFGDAPGNKGSEDHRYASHGVGQENQTYRVKYPAKTSDDLMQEIRSMTSGGDQRDYYQTVGNRSGVNHSGDMNLEDIMREEDSQMPNSEMEDRTPSPLPISIVTDNEASRHD